MTNTSRIEQLTVRLAVANRRIDSALHAAGRTDRPELIVVTKYFPAEDIRILAGLGVRDVGENKDQEAGAKARELTETELRWHFIGQLQTNKARSVARYAHSVHSVDRPSLVTALGKAAATERTGEGAPLACYVQVDLSGSDGVEEGISRHQRGGAAPTDVITLGTLIDTTEGLHLAGVMGVAPLGRDPREAFGQLAKISASLSQQFPCAVGISAGMSGDLEAAIAAGATHLRIGSQILGERPPLR